MRSSHRSGSSSDVIVVKRASGTLVSSSFHVSFGHRWAGHMVNVTVNTARVPVWMRVNEHGFAMWNAAPRSEPLPSSSLPEDLEDSVSSAAFSEVIGSSSSNSNGSPHRNPNESSSSSSGGIMEVIAACPHSKAGGLLAHPPSEELEELVGPLLKPDTYVSPSETLEYADCSPLPSERPLGNSPTLTARSDISDMSITTDPNDFSHKPSAAELAAMNLRYGENSIQFSVAGETWSVNASVYLWNANDRLVISDVDGTITKSDLLGHAYALVGHGGKWIHPSICSLYTSVAQNGYHFVYLTARSLHQSQGTRNFLFGLHQGQDQLPRGPVFSSPSSFFRALREEVSRRSHLFKIECLLDIRAAFPTGVRPLFAAFGNRGSDFVAYKEVGVPTRHIYILDTQSVVSLGGLKFHLSSTATGQLLDCRFPPRRHHRTSPPSTRPQRRHHHHDKCDSAPLLTADTRLVSNSGNTSSRSNTTHRYSHQSSSLAQSSQMISVRVEEEEEVEFEEEFADAMFWRIDPTSLITAAASTAPPSAAVAKSSGKQQQQSSSGTSTNTNTPSKSIVKGGKPNPAAAQDPPVNQHHLEAQNHGLLPNTPNTEGSHQQKRFFFFNREKRK